VTRRSECFVLWLFAATLCITYLYKGHGVSRKGEFVAFVHRTSVQAAIRLAGVVPRPGVYHFPEGTTLADVITMTLPVSLSEQDGECLCFREITAGDIVTVSPGENQHAEISLSTMNAQEKMLLGIPLNPDLMDSADWEALPGIGPELAKAIVDDRHKNGEFGAIDHLIRVPGIGEKRIEALRRYFL